MHAGERTEGDSWEDEIWVEDCWGACACGGGEGDGDDDGGYDVDDNITSWTETLA